MHKGGEGKGGVRLPFPSLARRLTQARGLLNDQSSGACSCAGEWPEIEARYYRAEEAILQAQQQNCKAAHEFLAARTEVRQLLEAVFPGAGLVYGPGTLDPILSEPSRALRG